ncbi:uncharacterized protein MONBRDRAFT_9289 [Monosiga brevicollis MX1]|uniref:guanylate cyclase n=1 Tax=Monosiga brevicollis TaxID=81824 RepID=A9V2N7_MONBE|nr:uncharacterized protein MONBRDRAFT_9289 [Monosiga brevicollis MX1]EDQ88290.1 predicted protein [Monosiga brevicollis MX1]|eukprot:XP_001746883.1 hypothetical protein [Monosiga brevicollis MX1]
MAARQVCLGVLAATLAMAMATSTYRIGVVHNSYQSVAELDMKATFESLGINYTFVVGTMGELREAVRLSEVDLIYSQPDLLTCLDTEYDVRLLGTVSRIERVGESLSVAGGVIFTRFDDHISHVTDITDHVIGAVSPDSLFGYMAQRRELLDQGIQLLRVAKAEELSLVVDNSSGWSCGELASDLSGLTCPDGYKMTANTTCGVEAGFVCPERANVTYLCACNPCEPICGKNEVFASDGSCDCQSGTIRIGSSCQSVGLAIAQVVAPILVALLILILYCAHRQRRKADGIWQIKADALIFDNPPDVLGAGSFGVVLAAKYRGERVAVKRAFAHSRSRGKSKATQSRFKRTATSGYSETFATMQARDRAVKARLRDFFVDAEANAHNSSRAVGKASQIGSESNSRPQVPWYTRIFHPTAGTRARNQLIQEMRTLSRLQHPNITQMRGAVMESGMEPLMVLEYMEMGSLYSMLHNEAMSFDDDFRYDAVFDIISGMRYLHSSEFTHGDLKAMNCLVNAKFQIKVADFGMAARVSSRGQRGGTLAWMAPEVLMGGVITQASDVYSFGVTMFEIFSREDPYDEAGLDSQTLAQHIIRRKLRPGIPENMPPEFSVLMNECLLADPDTRPTFIELLRRTEPLEGKMKASSRKGNPAFQDNALLEQVFPKHIAAALREGRPIEPEHHAEVTIFFSDICGFTDMSATLEPVQVSNMLDRLYTKFDKLCDQHGLYKIETIGDAYMCVGNLFTPQPDHAARVARFAMDAMEAANAIPILEDEPDGAHIDIRVGFHSGPVVSNVVGTLTPRFCLFGSTVNCASRMESNSVRNCIHMSPEAAALVQKQDVSLNVIRRDPMVTIKGLGKMQTYWLNKEPKADDVEASALEPPRRKRLSSTASIRTARISGVSHQHHLTESASKRASMDADLILGSQAKNVPQRARVMFDDVAIDMVPVNAMEAASPDKAEERADTPQTSNTDIDTATDLGDVPMPDANGTTDDHGTGKTVADSVV